MRRKTLLLIIFLAGKLILHLFLINGEYDLHRDEFLHLDQGKHLAWGYISVPPFTSWVSWLIFALGGTTFWVKFFPALFGALTILVVWKTVEALGGKRWALVIAASAMMFSVLARINILFQPNSFDILCWSSLFYFVVKYQLTGKSKWLFSSAIIFGLGFLNKYNIAFLALGLLPAFLLTEMRNLFVKKEIYFAAGISLLIIAPNLAWQYSNGFPAFHHMRELAETQLIHVHRADFLKEQALFFLNSIFLLILAMIAFFTYSPFHRFRWIFWTYLFCIATFTYLKAKGYYAIGLYPILIAFGAVYFETVSSKKQLKLLRPLSVTVMAGLFLGAIPKMFPVQSPEIIAKHSLVKGLHRWEDGKDYQMPQDFADMLGWRELARKSSEAYRRLPDKKQTLVLCDNYGEAGAINFYARDSVPALSLNADYINWFDFSNQYIQVLSVKEPGNTLEIESQLFGQIDTLGTVEQFQARERGAKIYLLSQPRAGINELLKREIEKRKAFTEEK